VSDLLAIAGALVTVLVIGLLLSPLAAPFDSLSWWAGWVRQRPEEPESAPARAAAASGPAAPGAPAAPAHAGPFVVFLSGVGTMGRQIDAWEQRLTDRLAAGMREPPGAGGGVMVTGLFPFSASAQPLAERRRTGAFWGRLERLRDAPPGRLTALADQLVNWRNLTQVLVSMDPRYGPIYDAGGARSLYAALLNHGFVPGSGAPVVLVGYSGGAQVCLGAATYLKPALGAPRRSSRSAAPSAPCGASSPSTAWSTSTARTTSSRSCRPSSCPPAGAWPGAPTGTGPWPTGACASSSCPASPTPGPGATSIRTATARTAAASWR